MSQGRSAHVGPDEIYPDPLLTPGEAFDAPGYLRISYATSMEKIEKGLDRLEKFVKELS